MDSDRTWRATLPSDTLRSYSTTNLRRFGKSFFRRPSTIDGAGCEFAVTQTLLACAPVEGNSFIRARCGQNKACGSGAAHGRACACSRRVFVHTLRISCPGVCQFCPTTSRGSSDVPNVQPAPSIVDGRRKKLFPHLRRFVVDDDLKVSAGRVARTVLSESMSAQ